MLMSPRSSSCRFVISNTGAPSPELELKPGSCTRTRLELGFNITEATSNDGENCIALIWKGALTLTHVRYELQTCDRK